MIIRILRFLLSVAIFLAGVFGYYIFEKTLAPWWIPVGVSLSATLLALPLYKRWAWLTGMSDRWVNIFCHIVCTALCVWAFFLVGNYEWASPTSTKEVEVRVLDRRMEKHQKRRRATRYTYVNAGIRYEYYLTVAFEDGRTTTLHVSRSAWNRAKKGQPWKLVVRNGRFGLPVITEGL